MINDVNNIVLDHRKGAAVRIFAMVGDKRLGIDVTIGDLKVLSGNGVCRQGERTEGR
jgi:hypothetical protein